MVVCLVSLGCRVYGGVLGRSFWRQYTLYVVQGGREGPGKESLAAVSGDDTGSTSYEVDAKGRDRSAWLELPAAVQVVLRRRWTRRAGVVERCTPSKTSAWQGVYDDRLVVRT